MQLPTTSGVDRKRSTEHLACSYTYVIILAH
jgi:hypothetical protein